MIEPRKILVSSMSLFAAITSLTLSAAIPAGDYDTVDTNNAASLRITLHDIIKDHQRFPYTASTTDTWDILELADENPDDASKIITLYKNETYSKVTGGNNFYNREHTWPKSYGFPNNADTNYPYTDMHHLFLADSGYNADRSNKPYADCNSGCTEDPSVANNGRGGGATDSNWTIGDFSAGNWETWDSRKGDVARALMYMDVRYEGGTHGITGASEPDLILTNDRVLIENSFTGGNEMVAYMGILSTLIQWHKMDPVDDFERRHTDAVYSFQNNRNPFIDHPEYVACVFEGVCNGGGADTTAPTTPAGMVATGGNLKIDLSWSANSETDLAGYKVYRRDVAGGATTRLTDFPIASTSYSDASLSAGTSYFYLVSAVDLSANESPLSSEVSATTDAAPPPPPPPAPPASSGGGGSLGIIFSLLIGLAGIRRKL